MELVPRNHAPQRRAVGNMNNIDAEMNNIDAERFALSFRLRLTTAGRAGCNPRLPSAFAAVLRRDESVTYIGSLCGYTLMKNGIIAASLGATILMAGCGKKSSSSSATPPPVTATQSSSPLVQSADTSDPYPGSGGLFLGTPDRQNVDSGRINFTPERFASFKVGSTTKTQVTALLGKPAGWLTETNGTSQLEYDYVEPGGASDLRKIIYVFFIFDDKRVLTRLKYPDYDSDKNK